LSARSEDTVRTNGTPDWEVSMSRQGHGSGERRSRRVADLHSPIAAVKKVLIPGQVKPKGAVVVQRPSSLRMKLRTPVHTKLEMRVAHSWATKV
jgi:hypothetical protein